MQAARTDALGRKLAKGETFDEKTRRYRYSYRDALGKRRELYSWTLLPADVVPSGKRQGAGESLREKEKRVGDELRHRHELATGDITVLELMEQYVAMRSPHVRESTRQGYRAQLKFMQGRPFGQLKIREVNSYMAERWLTELHSREGRNYHSIDALRGILRPAFHMAEQNRWIDGNPFSFTMAKKDYGGVRERDALSPADMARFLRFVRTDPGCKRYFNGVYILFHTGLRISEFCGLCLDDIDFEDQVIHVRRQLFRYARSAAPEEDAAEAADTGNEARYYIDEPKSASGKRDIPMLPGVVDCFREVIAARPRPEREPVVWNTKRSESHSGFLWWSQRGQLETGCNWDDHLEECTSRFNRAHREDPIPKVTPHICRHTFCSNCAGSGMSSKTLQLLMGHSSIGVTLDVYTHMDGDEVRKQFLELADTAQEYFLPREELSAEEEE